MSRNPDKLKITDSEDMQNTKILDRELEPQNEVLFQDGTSNWSAAKVVNKKLKSRICII